jgi:DNA-binding transcriptional regulator YiaG
MERTQQQLRLEELALKMGVRRQTIMVWRHRRKVPWRWQLRLLKAAKGKLPLTVFDTYQ